MLTAVSGRYVNTVTYTYDTAGRKKTEGLTISGKTYTTTTAYNNRNELIQYTYPDSTVVQRTYTDRGELYQNKLAGTVIDTRSYDDGGRMTGSTYDNGVAETRTYGTDNTLTAINFGGTGTAIGNLTYGWDVNKNKKSEAIAGTMSNYGFTVPNGTSGYDNEDRLVTYNRISGLSQSWNLSTVGDWNSVTTNGASQSRTHGPTHELLTAAGQNVTTDVKGNITLIPAALRANGQALATTWDFDNRMVTADVGDNGSIEVSQKYDALGRRVSRTDGSTTTVFALAGQQVICDYVSGAAPAASTYRYLYASYIDEPVLRVTTTGSVKTYYHRNQQYSVIALTSSTGAVQERYAYTAYGEPTVTNASGTVLTSSAQQNRYLYTGQEWDNVTQQYHFNARTYDAKLGRFSSRDPIGYGSYENQYAYVANRSLCYVDPSGMQSVVTICRVELRCGNVMSGYKHCGVVVNDTEYGMSGDAGMPDRPNGKGKEDGATLFGKGGGCPPTYKQPASSEIPPDIDTYKWECRNPNGFCDATQKCFEDYQLNTPTLPYAALDGPNSNTYLRKMLEACGCKGPKPKNAPNFDNRSPPLMIFGPIIQ